MRVLVVSAWEPWRRGDGACLVLHAHLRELAARHDLELLAAGAAAVESPVPPGALTVPARWFGTARPRLSDAVIRRLRPSVDALFVGEPAHVGYVMRPAMLAALQERIASDPPDLVHLFGWGTAGLHALLGGLPAVHDAVDPWAAHSGDRRRNGVAALLSSPRLDGRETARIRAHEARHYPRLDAVVVRTEPDAVALRRQVPTARVRVVPNGVSPGLGSPTHEPLLAFLGAYDTVPNVRAARELAGDILPLVRERRSDARALLIGRDPPASVRRLSSATVEVTGTVDDVAPVLARAAVFVAPMRTGGGVKNKVLEAMAAGVPVVATPLGLRGISPSVGVVAAESAGELAGVAARWLADPAARAAAGEDNRRRAEQEFSWDASAAALEQVWLEALRTRAGGTCASPS